MPRFQAHTGVTRHCFPSSVISSRWGRVQVASLRVKRVCIYKHTRIKLNKLTWAHLYFIRGYADGLPRMGCTLRRVRRLCRLEVAQLVNQTDNVVSVAISWICNNGMPRQCLNSVGRQTLARPRSGLLTNWQAVDARLDVGSHSGLLGN